jgi:hypothetical protein
MRSLRSPLAIDTSTQVTILNRLRVLNSGDATSSKVCYHQQIRIFSKSCCLQVDRAIRFMCEETPEVANRVLLDQIVKEMIAAEKLRVVESKRDYSRTTGERFRKDMRLSTT